MSPELEKLCVPTRVVSILEKEYGIQDRLIDLGGIHMLDLQAHACGDRTLSLSETDFRSHFLGPHSAAHPAALPLDRAGH